MDPAQALADLTEISSQIEAAILLGEDGSTTASTVDGARSEEVARAVQELFAAARRVPGRDGLEFARLEVATASGSVFLVHDGGRTIAAVTKPEPTVGLVFYDLKSTLRGVAQEERPKPKPRRAPRSKAAAASESGGDGGA